MWELTKSFRFEAAHALPGTTLGAASEEIHGHSFRAEVTVRGLPDPATGMVLDLGRLERSMAGVIGAVPGGSHETAGVGGIERGRRVVFQFLEGRANLIAQGLKPAARERLAIVDDGDVHAVFLR